MRSDNPAYLTKAGWSALYDHGIRTVVALRTVGAPDDEPDPALVPLDVRMERVLVEDVTDTEFRSRCVNTGLFATPLYFLDMLEGWPERCAAAVAAVAGAGAGGVVISCGRGCDRTGLVVFLLLAMVGVPAEEIAADWSLSVDRLRSRDPSYETVLDQILARYATTVVDSIHGSLAVGVLDRLRVGGLHDDDIRRIQRRLLG